MAVQIEGSSGNLAAPSRRWVSSPLISHSASRPGASRCRASSQEALPWISIFLNAADPKTGGGVVFPARAGGGGGLTRGGECRGQGRGIRLPQQQAHHPAACQQNQHRPGQGGFGGLDGAKLPKIPRFTIPFLSVLLPPGLAVIHQKPWPAPCQDLRFKQAQPDFEKTRSLAWSP